MIARRDPSPPRSGAARPAGRLRLLLLLVVAAAAAAPTRRLLAARAVSHQPERDGAASAVLPVLRGEPVAGHRVPARTDEESRSSRDRAHLLESRPRIAFHLEQEKPASVGFEWSTCSSGAGRLEDLDDPRRRPRLRTITSLGSTAAKPPSRSKRLLM